MPCGLILNELLTNAFKYAFPNRERGQIIISAKVSDKGVFELAVRDDGVGLRRASIWKPRKRSASTSFRFS